MATNGSALRRGLPRVKGGEPWPPAGAAPAAPRADAETAAAPVAQTAAAPAPAPAAASVAAPAPTAPAAAAATQAPAPAAAAPAPSRALRRGLPRVKGGEPWPPAGAAPVAASVAAPAAAGVTGEVSASAPSAAAAPAAVVTDTAPLAPAAAAVTAETPTDGVPLRRGLPRVRGGEPWPPAGFASAPVLAAPPASEPAAERSPDLEPALAPVAAAQSAELVVAAEPARPSITEPLRLRPTVTAGRYAFIHPEPVEPRRYGRFTALQWTGLIAGGGLGLLGVTGMAIVFVQWFNSLSFMTDFFARYPGSYDLPDFATPGFPAWARWQHSFNLFVMVLIIRSGWQVRRERRPDAFWTPKWSKNGRGKISLTLWLHQSVDILWFANGILFVVLLFASGHWVRIVPTSWDVFPNALSAVLQYLSLDWPTEHGWVNYNSIQQLMYFITVFVAAPLAAITGVRMSGLWPKKAATLNRIYPVEIARAVHFPVMLYFVIFILIHVTLVFATGALRNLNHMFGGTDAENWAGFWIFGGSLVLLVAIVLAARPAVLAPIARLSGKVSTR